MPAILPELARANFFRLIGVPSELLVITDQGGLKGTGIVKGIYDL